MKLSILLSSAILFATALTPVSAYADDSNLMCRRSGCDSRNGGGGNLSISGFDINVKSSDRGNRNRNTVDRNTVKNDKNDKNDNNDVAENDHADTDDTDNADAGNDVADNTPDAGNDNADAGTDNTDAGNVDPGTDNTDTGASNNSPPQSNSNDIKGFDPFGGLYGPGT